MEAKDTVRGALLTDVLWSDPDTTQQGITLDGADGTVRGSGGADAAAAAAAAAPSDGGSAAGAEDPLRCDEESVDPAAAADAAAAAAGGHDNFKRKAAASSSSSAASSREWEHSSDEEDEDGMIANSVGIGESTRGEGICTFDERVVRGFLRRCAISAFRSIGCICGA